MNLLLENDAVRPYGCLMCMPPESYKPHFIKFGKTAVFPSSVYTEPNDDSYSYETDPHLTLKYGYSPDLTKQNLAYILQGIKPFAVTLKALNLFENDKFDVVKFSVQPNDTLLELRKRCDAFLNEDKYPDYTPHVTVAYVKKGTFPHRKENLNIKFPISRFKYSGGNGKKLYINL